MPAGRRACADYTVALVQAVTPRPRDVQHLIICGAEKAGTTSLFGYLAAHPGVVASSKKENDFRTVCLGAAEGALPSADTGLAAWHLGAIARGRYERLLPPFERHFAPQQMLVLAHAALQRDARAAVQRIAEHAGLDPTPYRDHVFARENVSFMARHAGMQRVAVAVNDSLEGLWRRHPGLKRQLLAAYKRFNERPMDADELDPSKSASESGLTARTPSA